MIEPIYIAYHIFLLYFSYYLVFLYKISYVIADKAIEKLDELHIKSQQTSKPFVLGIGFKQPHTSYHLPRRYFNMYKGNQFLKDILNTTNPLRFMYPAGAPRTNYRCCAYFRFWPMVEEGHLLKRLHYICVFNCLFSYK